jgi:two-component system sensor histidine kinase KdpD
MTRLGYGTLQPNREWVELRETIGRALRQMARPLAPMKIDVQIRDDMPILHVDPVLIEQVLVNILDNAAKYSRAGGRIEIAAALDGEQVRVGVSDEGPGIPPEARDAVFACAPATSRQPGQGLGCRFAVAWSRPTAGGSRRSRGLAGGARRSPSGFRCARRLR